MQDKSVWAFRAILILAVVAIVYFGGLLTEGDPEANNSSGVLPANETNISVNPSNYSSNSTAEKTFNSSGNFTATYGLDAETKLRSEKLTSLFENDRIELQYGYSEDLGDGRGITCGRAGFCTGCEDAYEVVKLYSEKKPGNILAKYLPELERLNTAEDSSDTSGLNGFTVGWKQAASDALFRNAQDEVSDKLYYRPAMDYAEIVGLRTNLAKAVLYDSIIQHGNGDDPDGLMALLDRTEEGTGGNPKSGIDESVWLKKFLEIRRADLVHAYDAETRSEWAKSVSRVDVFSEILESGNMGLKGPITIANGDYKGRVIP